MTQSNTRHAVCPECHTHQLTLPDGRLVEHDAAVRLYKADAHGGLPDGVGARALDDCAWPAQVCYGHLADSHGATIVHRCPGSEDWPNRAAGNGTAYGTTSQFASCPAATGEGRCRDYPDHAHRCQLNRDHLTPGAVEHSCTCGAVWHSVMGTVKNTVDGLVALVNRELS
jgi:hypothetical protein